MQKPIDWKRIACIFKINRKKRTVCGCNCLNRCNISMEAKLFTMTEVCLHWLSNCCKRHWHIYWFASHFEPVKWRKWFKTLSYIWDQICNKFMLHKFMFVIIYTDYSCPSSEKVETIDVNMQLCVTNTWHRSVP